MKTPHRSHLLFLLLPLTFAATAAAQGIYIDRPVRPIDRPAPVEQRLELERHAVRASVHGNLVEFAILQRFRNQSGRTIEGTYLFPIPRHAVATGLTLSIGGKQVAGEVLEAGKAKGIYQDIVRRMRDPALLEYVNDGLLRASIFPIEAHSQVEIGIRFVAPLEPVGDLFSLRLPLKFAAPWNAEVMVDVRLESALPLTTIYSPSHDVDLVRDGDRKARVTYEGRNSADFLLYFARSESDVGLSLLTNRLPAKDGTFALLISPKLDTTPGHRQPRNVIFVLDRSGSMAGEKWTQAVAALTFGLRSLEPEDRFALVSFATDVRSYKSGLVPAFKEEIRGAVAHLESLRPAGGTNIADSLQTALSMLDQDPTRLEVIPFLTDGLPTIGQVKPEGILKQVHAANEVGARLFCFGVGYDVNPLLLDRLAADNGGAADYVTEGENLELRVSAFFARTRHPVLTGPELRFHGVEVFDMHPRKLPDLFAGSSVLVTGRYRGSGAHAVTLTGRGKAGERSLTAELRFPLEERGAGFLPALWAARRVGYLLNEIRLHGAAKELVDAVVDLGREYGIVTPYTSALVLEEGERLRRISGAPPIPGRHGGAMGPGVAGLRPEGETRSRLEQLDASERDEEAGEKAVERAKSGRRLREATSLSATRAWAAEQRIPVETVQVAGRRLLKAGDLHIDMQFEESMAKSMRVLEAFSDEFFQLLEQHPELAPLLALGPELIFVLDGAAVRIR